LYCVRAVLLELLHHGDRCRVNKARLHPSSSEPCCYFSPAKTSSGRRPCASSIFTTQPQSRGEISQNPIARRHTNHVPREAHQEGITEEARVQRRYHRGNRQLQSYSRSQASQRHIAERPRPIEIQACTSKAVRLRGSSWPSLRSSSRYNDAGRYQGRVP
jgi:hypothetical protein